MNLYSIFFKRFFDVFLSLILLFIFSPILLTTTIIIFINTKSNPFFIQKRPGLDEKTFLLIKFKTMNDKKDLYGNLLPDGMRLTKIGRIIRKTSIDELPQLINVLKSDMSIVGPRPLLMKYMPFYYDYERIRHSVKPGITGLAQVNGRNLLNWDDRLKLDVEYVQNMSFLLDFKIVMLTINNVIFAKDIVVDANLKMQDLNDYRNEE